MNGAPAQEDEKLFCFFCERTFDDESVLTQHQKAKHFRCLECPVDAIRGKCESVQGLIVHTLKVHGKGLARVPNAMQGRDSSEWNVYGMDGIPDHIWEEKGLPIPGSAPEPAPPPPRPLESPLDSSTALSAGGMAAAVGVPQDFLDFLGQAAPGGMPGGLPGGMPGAMPAGMPFGFPCGMPAMPLPPLPLDTMSQPGVEQTMPAAQLEPPVASLSSTLRGNDERGSSGSGGVASGKRTAPPENEDVSVEEKRARLGGYLTPR